MRAWREVGVVWARQGAGGGWADVDRFWMGGNHWWWRGDVQRDGIRRDTTVHVGIRWVMAMRTWLGPTSGVVVVSRRDGRLLLGGLGLGDGHIWSTIGIS